MNEFTELYPWEWTKIDKVFIEDNMIKADLDAKVESYNPFDHYDFENSIFDEFIKIDLNDHSSIINFINTYGFLTVDASGGPSYHDEEDILRPRYELLSDFVDEFVQCKQLSDLYAWYCSDAKNTNEILEKVEKIVSKHLSNYSNIKSQLIISNADDDTWLNENLKPFIMGILAHEINERIKTVKNKLIINKDSLGFENSWSATDLISIIYLMFYLRISGKKILRICKNTYCNKGFFIIKNDKRKVFCSPECAQQSAMHKYREKNKDEINAKRRLNRKHV